VAPQAADLAGSDAASRLKYDVVDVFTDRAFAGNPLAVVYEADSLDTAQLQAITSEFNLSETAFPATPSGEDRAQGADYAIRIFTPDGEVPFAGHPTLGTAWALSHRGQLPPGARVQACGAGLIDVAVPSDLDAPVELSALPRDPASAVSSSDTEQLAELAGVAPGDVTGTAYAAGCGLSWLYLPVTAVAVTRSRPSARRISETAIDLSLVEGPVEGVAVYAVDASEGGIAVRSRVYVPGSGISEDPATGSAAAALGIALVETGRLPAGGRYTIRQGVEMGRPSTLAGRVDVGVDGRPVLCHVAGEVQVVASGEIVVPC
jgi:trans-2,3-dihydro-3-hydroxyanthranilate isomerase